MFGKKNDQGGFMVTPVQSKSDDGNGWGTSLAVAVIIFLIAIAMGKEDEDALTYENLRVPEGAADLPAHHYE